MLYVAVGRDDSGMRAGLSVIGVTPACAGLGGRVRS